MSTDSATKGHYPKINAAKMEKQTLRNKQFENGKSERKVKY